VSTEQPDATSPGTRYRHYAPACAVEVVAADQLVARARALVAQGVRTGTVAPARVRIPDTIPIADFADVDELAHDLYGALRDAEQAGVDVLLCAAVPEVGVGRAVMDRLRRAAGT
jgi:L-threonylcarbamoyladenylate synthase